MLQWLISIFVQRHGKRLDHEEKVRKKEARSVHKASHDAQTLHGKRAKILHAFVSPALCQNRADRYWHAHSKRYAEKVSMRKKIKAHEERNVKTKDVDALPEGALPAYLLDREGTNNAKALSSALKDKRKDKAGKFAVPLPKVRGIAEDEAFKVIKTGKRKQKGWKRLSV